MVLKFCGIPVKSRFFLSPMANVTALPFRLMCKRMGAGLTITEQINATHIARNPDPFTNKPYIEMYATRRVGGQIVLPEAMKILTIKA